MQGAAAMTFVSMDPDRQLGYLLARAASRAQKTWAIALNEHGINPRQFSMLALLASDPGLSQAELGRRVMITPQSASESLAALAAQGLIARERAEPGKASQVEVTATGKAVLRRAYPIVERVTLEVFGSLSRREQSKLAELLRKLL